MKDFELYIRSIYYAIITMTTGIYLNYNYKIYLVKKKFFFE